MAAGSGVVVSEALMAAETWSAVVDFNLVLRSLLWDSANKRPYDLWAYIYDDPTGGDLLYPPLQLTTFDGDEEGLILGGVGVLTDLGSGGIGPTIVDREYVSGFDKLSNGSFDLDDLYWQRPAEGSLWVLLAGTATNAGGLHTDDVLEYDRKFPTRPGHEHRATAVSVSGLGRLRIRTIYEGTFHPADLLVNGDFEAGASGWAAATNLAIVASGARSGTYAMRVSPIPKPQLISGSEFASGAGWNVGATHTISDGTLIASPNTQPQYIADPGFETGGGWTDQIGPPSRPMSNDIDIVNDPANAYGGTGGAATSTTSTVPLTVNNKSEYDSWLASMPNGTSFPTFEANSLADPNRGASGYVQDFNGTWTSGAATPVPLTINNFGTYNSWLASMPNGTSYPTFEANDLGDANRGVSGYIQDFDGGWVPESATPGPAAYVMSVGPITQHQVFINADFGAGLTNWYASSSDADPHAVWITDVGGGNNGTDGLRTVGWSTAGRPGPELVKYLRADSVAGSGVDTYAVAPGETYTAEAYVRGHPGTDGSFYISLMIPHPSVPAHDLWFVSKEIFAPPNDVNQWVRLTIENVTIPANRLVINALAEAHNHSLGHYSLDTYTLTRTRGNRAQINSDATYAVSADTEYELAALVRSDVEGQVGSVRIGVILSGAGLDDEVVDIDKGFTDYEWSRTVLKFKPRAGYTSARPFVAGLDIIGEPTWIDNITLTKVSKNTAISTHTPFAVTTDQRYLLSADVTTVGATRGEITVGVHLTGPGVTLTEVEVSHGVGDARPKAISVEVRPPPGYTTATPYVRSTDIEGGTFTVDAMRLVKMDNNSDSSAGSTIPVTPERTYRWLQAVRSGTALQRGTVRLSVRCTRAGYEDVTFDSSNMEPTAGAWKFIDFSFTPPSGYDEIIPTIIGTDVEGDYWFLDDGSLRDTDSSTMVFEAVTANNPSAVTPYVDSTAPDGAETVRVAVVVEQGSSTWTVNAVTLVRTDGTPATGASIVADLLIHPQTGNPLSIGAGTITAPAVIPSDVVIQNRTSRDALDYLCGVLYPELLEYRVLPTDPPTLDVGPAATVFDTHDPADALLPEDLDVEELSNPSSDITDRPTEVTVLGAELAKVSGGTFLITATAQVPGPTRYDGNNNVVVRTKYVSDGTVDHVGYAQALATDLAAAEAEPPLILTAKLSGKDTRADSPPGTTIYAYEPEAGLEDPDVVTTIEGATVFPRATRVLSRERVHGPSHRIVMRRPDGTEFPLTGVRWSEEDAVVLTIGDRLPEWIADPQGRATGDQYLADRAKRPR